MSASCPEVNTHMTVKYSFVFWGLGQHPMAAVWEGFWVMCRVGTWTSFCWLCLECLPASQELLPGNSPVAPLGHKARSDLSVMLSSAAPLPPPAPITARLRSLVPAVFPLPGIEGRLVKSRSHVGSGHALWEWSRQSMGFIHSFIHSLITYLQNAHSCAHSCAHSFVLGAGDVNRQKWRESLLWWNYIPEKETDK